MKIMILLSKNAHISFLKESIYHFPTLISGNYLYFTKFEKVFIIFRNTYMHSLFSLKNSNISFINIAFFNINLVTNSDIIHYKFHNQTLNNFYFYGLEMNEIYSNFTISFIKIEEPLLNLVFLKYVCKNSNLQSKFF